MKILKKDSYDRLEDFLKISGQWAFLNCDQIVRLYGITLNDISFILEYFPIGPLDEFLRNNRQHIENKHLVEAAKDLASALWHIDEKKIVHGKIRCRKLLVAYHDERKLTIKLTDPGIHSSYPATDIHWIPVECYNDFELARNSPEADVWAYGTTIWEMFSFGKDLTSCDHEDSKKAYLREQFLEQPYLCPNEIYDLIKECWEIDHHLRKNSQDILKTITQYFHVIGNAPVYARPICPPLLIRSSSSSMQSLPSVRTESTNIYEYGSIRSIEDSYDGLSFGKKDNDLDDFNPTCSFDKVNRHKVQEGFRVDKYSYVVRQRKIGQGNYGEVFEGKLCYDNDTKKPRTVAFKKLITMNEDTLLDFEREIIIMQQLKHPNIVQILNVVDIYEKSLIFIMEFVMHGSLQNYLRIHKERIEDKERLQFALDIIKGMEYLESKKIVHRDLAARNILVDDKKTAKISDFGLAQMLDDHGYYQLKTERGIPYKWYALECLTEHKFSTSSDVWSFGVVLWEIFSDGEEPNMLDMDDSHQDVQMQFILKLQQGFNYPVPLKCKLQKVYTLLILPCWNRDRKARPKFKDLMRITEEILRDDL